MATAIVDIKREIMDFNELKVYSPGYQAINWGFDYNQLVDLDTALRQPRSIAVLPVYCDRQTEFSYLPQYSQLDLAQFDLVLFTDIEYRYQSELLAWIQTQHVNNWLLMLGYRDFRETPHTRAIWSPSWIFSFIPQNQTHDDFPRHRAWLWDALLGARREHRDFVMLSFQHSDLLDRSLVTYRDIFLNASVQAVTPRVQCLWPHAQLRWPYVSPNLDPAWEVRADLDNTISSIVPWQIYDRSYYSIIVETFSEGNTQFGIAEKIAKCLFARRLFVHFGVGGWLARLRDLGFQTFDNVMDESYDSEPDDVTRWQQAWQQVQQLSKQDPEWVLDQIRDRLDHNRDHLFAFRRTKLDQCRQLVMDYLNA